MTTQETAAPSRRSLLAPVAARRRRGAGVDSGRAAQAARGLVADLLRRLLRQALQRAEADQPDDREEPHARLGRRAQRRARESRRRFGGGGAAAAGRSSAARAPAISSPAAAARSRASRAHGGRHALRHDARQRLGARRARRARAVALLLEDARRHAHRQSRPRDVEQLPLHGDARQLPGVARREDRQGALAQGRSPTSTSSTSRRRRRSSSATTCSSARATTSTRPASCSRSIPRPASCSGSSTPCR